MNSKRNLTRVAILALVILVCGLNLAPSAQAVNKVTNVVAALASPSALLNNDHVNFTFDYTTDEAGGVRIRTVPYTNGSPTSSYGVCGSSIYSLGSGSGACFITVTSGDVVVDQIRVRMYTADWNVVLVEFYLNVEYHFGNSITNINMTPASPAQLMTGQKVNITFDCVTEEASGGIVFARPYTNGSLTPGYNASGGFIFTGIDSGSQWFRINLDNQSIDQVHFEMYNNNQSVLLLDFFVDVDYHVCDSGSCTWYVDADATGADTGSNWANAFTDLQDALDVAWPGEEIWVAQGTYKPDQGGGQTPGDRSASFTLIDGVGVYGGFDGTESSVSARDVQANETILSGEIGAAVIADNSYHVVRSTGNGSTALLDGFTVTGGNANGDTTPFQLGGGMILESNASPTIANSIFVANNAVSGGGLGAWQGGASSILNCDFIDNVATGGTGGGIYIQAHNPTIRSTRFIGNSAQRGGGLYALNNTAPFELRNCLFNCNAATSVSTGGGGGAIYSAGTGGNPNLNPPDLINCTLVFNTSTLPGGGIYNSGGGGTDITLDSCILWFNSDPAGMVESSQYTAGGAPSIQYSNIQGWTGALGGVGNIGADPLFADADGIDDTPCTPDDDFRLTEGSPSVGTGNPDVAFNDPDGSRNDMGAFGGPGGEEGGVGVFPGSGFIFTTVGVVPTSEITQTGGDPALLQGTANVSPAAAADLSIPAYKNTAFGRSLWLHGLFGDADTQVDFYQVQAGLWSGNTPPAEVDFENLDDKLVKVLYTYDPVPGEWTSQRITLGPQMIDGVDDLYQLTTTGFWSLIDLRMVWNTRNYANGKYTLRIKAYQGSGGPITDVTGSLGAVADVIIYIDNSPVTATIHSVKYDPANPNYDLPTDGDIPTCGIISLVNNTENLRFNVTASHPNGFLRLWRLDALFGSNQNAGIIAGQSYSSPPALWSGIAGQEFASVNATALAPWVQCAYQFRLRSWARVTNGYSYIIYSTFNEHLTVDLGGGGCGRADIDGSGVVDIFDLSLLGSHWLESCNN